MWVSGAGQSHTVVPPPESESQASLIDTHDPKYQAPFPYSTLVKLNTVHS
jgi:hypothetical protein